MYNIAMAVIDRLLKDEPPVVKRVFPSLYNHFVSETACNMVMKAGLDDFDFLGVADEEKMGEAMVHVCELLTTAVKEIWSSP